jgi:lysophospholipase L1-like esterase
VAAVYVALGDSMSIDDYAGGVGRGAASLLWRNQDTDFPDWAGHDLATAGYTAQILARDGAVSADVLQRQLPLIDRRPALVTITMGGNDLLATYGDSAAARSVIDEVAATGEAILSRLRALSADCRIILTTVYDPSDGTGEIPTAGLPAWSDAVQLVAELNQALTAIAARHSAAVADVHRRFLGHGTAAGDPAQSDPRPANRRLWYCGVIEPNAWGAAEIRRAWWDSLADTTNPART